MIDSGRFWIDRSGISPSILSHIINMSEYIGEDKKYQHQLIYRYKNWLIFLRDQEIVLAGSLTKYIFGNNQKTATLEECKKGLETLEAELQLPILKSIIRRVDIPMNFIVSQPVISYLLFMSSASLFSETKRYRTALEFCNTNRQMSFYDKVIEQKKHSQPILPLFNNRHVLRYEKKFLKNDVISSFIGVEKATVQDVIDNFQLLIKAWAKSYRSINKKTEINSYSPELFRSPKLFKDYLMRIGMDSLGGYLEIESLIKVANANRIFKYPSEMSHLKTKLKEVAAMDNQEVSLNYIKELNEKVDDAELFAYSQCVPWNSYEIGINDGVSERIL